MKIKEKLKNLPHFIKADKIKVPFLIIVFLLLMIVVLTFIADWKIGIGIMLLCVGIFGFISYSSEYLIDETNQYISDLSYRIKKGEQEALIKMPIGILLYNKQEEIQWMNPYLIKYFGKKDTLGRKLNVVDEELYQLFKGSHDYVMRRVKWGDHYFDMIIQEDIGVIYLMDITEYAKIEERYKDEKFVFGNIIVDNYDEAVQSMNDRKRSNVNNYLTNQLTNWANMNNVFLKRVDDDRFIALTNMRALNKIEENNFDIINQIRERTYKQNFPLTLSMGFSYEKTFEQTNFKEVAKMAQSNIDLALARGGDQVVVRAEDEDARFYGGKTNPMEKRTRIRARMISQALEELIVHADKVIIMGHSYPDMDVIGSCLGIRRISQMNSREAWIVLDPQQFSNDVNRIMQEIDKDPLIAKRIISPEQAMALVTPQTLIVMVDVHRPSMTPAPGLLNLSKKIVVLDHHRRGQEFPKDSVLVYMEPYASSTSELIAELFEYQSNEMDAINKIEATAMLAGIIVDTRNFSLRTGSRTFDAASYLQSNGADTVLIQKSLKEDLDTYLLRSHLLQTMEFVNGNLAIVHGEDEKIYDTVVAAQTADTMLSMEAVDASFVVTKRQDGRVGISARSLGQYNVQTIMEKLGGGGHLSNAATQIENTTVHEVVERLKAVIDPKKIKEGE